MSAKRKTARQTEILLRQAHDALAKLYENHVWSGTGRQS